MGHRRARPDISTMNRVGASAAFKWISELQTKCADGELSGDDRRELHALAQAAFTGLDGAQRDAFVASVSRRVQDDLDHDDAPWVQRMQRPRGYAPQICRDRTSLALVREGVDSMYGAWLRRQR